MQYTIYHPSDGEMNHTCELGKFLYEPVFSLNVNSLHDIFPLCQNDSNLEYKAINIRSTSVGDIVGNDETNAFYIIKGTGFLLISDEDVLNPENISEPWDHPTIGC